MNRLESSIQADMKKWLESQGAIVIKLTTAGQYGTKGWPDLLVVWPVEYEWQDLITTDVVHYFEVKRDAKHEPTPLQEDRMQQLRDFGYRVDVVWSLDQVKAIVKELRG